MGFKVIRTICIDSEIWEEAMKKARRQNRSLSSIVEELLRSYIQDSS